MKRLQWKWVVAYLPALFLMVVIFWFSSQPGVESSAESSRIVNLVLHGLEDIRGMKFSAREFTYWAERIHTPIRKLAHMMEYAVLAWTIFIPTLAWNREKLRKTVVGAKVRKCSPDKKMLGRICSGSVLVTMLYASTDEFHQLFVEGRSAKVTDVLIDTCGAVLGILGFLMLWKIVFLIMKKVCKNKKYK